MNFNKNIMPDSIGLTIIGEGTDAVIKYATSSSEAKTTLANELEMLGEESYGHMFISTDDFELFVDDQLVGLCLVSVNFEHDDDLPELFATLSLDAVVLHPEYRGLGLGSEFVEKAMVTAFGLINPQCVQDGYNAVSLICLADFMSLEGESVFHHGYSAIKQASKKNTSIKYDISMDACF